jgi:hypothetical protein
VRGLYRIERTGFADATDLAGRRPEVALRGASWDPVPGVPPLGSRGGRLFSHSACSPQIARDRVEKPAALPTQRWQAASTVRSGREIFPAESLFTRIRRMTCGVDLGASGRGSDIVAGVRGGGKPRSGIGWQMVSAVGGYRARKGWEEP